MRLTYTNLQDQYLRNIGQPDSSDTNILADFKLHLGQRYQLILAKLQNYKTQKPKTASTVASQQYYYYPQATVNVESCTITVGTVKYPLTVISSQMSWDIINAYNITTSNVPLFIFPRRDDFGIFPIPQDVYTITFNAHIRDRNLTIGDYTTGSIALTNGGTIITGTDTVFTAAMVGRWLEVTDETSTGQGYFYRISAYNSATSLTLETAWDGATGSGLTYRIGQSPEIPEEGHMLLIDGPTSDFYAGLRNDIESATWFNNKFWTGDGNNNSRNEGDQSVKSGLIGLMNSYSDRNNPQLVNRGGKLPLVNNSIFSQSIT